MRGIYMKRQKIIISLLLSVFILALTAACGARETGPADVAEPVESVAPVKLPEPSPAGEPLRLIVATDLHYISPRITDFGSAFMTAMMRGDGKLSEQCEAIVDELIRVTLEERPNALVLCGDLTYNGEQASLEDLSSKLRAVQAAGIPVLLVPGNHDVGNLFAFSFDGESAYYADNVTPAEFMELCADFGFNGAIARDEGSFSYVYELAEDCRLLFLDANTLDMQGGIREETLNWAEEQLAEAQERGITVISVTHQNMLRQSSLLYKGYVIKNANSAAALLRQYGVSVNLSGHSHIQHSAVEEGLTDYCTGSLSVAPLMYAVVELDESRAFSYRQEHLSILQEAAAARMEQSGRSKVAAYVESFGLDEETQELMTAFAVRLNMDYFAGTVDKEKLQRDPAFELWERYGEDTFWLPYIESMLNED